MAHPEYLRLRGRRMATGCSGGRAGHTVHQGMLDNGDMKLSFFAAFLPFAISAWAQPIPRFYQPLEQVKQFLQLTDSQVQTILTANEEYNRFAQEKQARIFQAQGEIAEETAKETLDPNALGIRYAEIESICRELKVRANQNRTRHLDALNPDQKTRLKALEDAIKLAPVILEAQYGNLIGSSSSAPYAFTSDSSSFGSVIGGIIGGYGGCYSPVPTLAIRNGDFSANPFSGNRIPANRIRGTALPQMGETGQRWFDAAPFVTAPAQARPAR